MEPNTHQSLEQFLAEITLDALEAKQTRVDYTIKYRGNLVDCELHVKRIYVPGLSTTKQ